MNICDKGKKKNITDLEWQSSLAFSMTLAAIFFRSVSTTGKISEPPAINNTRKPIIILIPKYKNN